MPGNLNKVTDVVKLGLQDPAAAKKKVQKYLQSDIPDGIKSLMEKAVKAPEAVQSTLQPWLKRASEYLPNENSLLYQAVGKPSWNFFSGLRYLGEQSIGQGLKGVAGLSKITLDSVREGADVVGERFGYKKDRVDSTFDTIDSKVDWVDGVASSLVNRGVEGRKKIDSRRRFRSRKSSENDITS